MQIKFTMWKSANGTRRVFDDRGIICADFCNTPAGTVAFDCFKASMARDTNHTLYNEDAGAFEVGSVDQIEPS